MKILDRLFPDYVRLAELDKEVRTLREENTKQSARLTEAQSIIASKQAEISALKANLREQTDADLLLVSARTAMKILRGEKPEPGDAALQQRLLLQQQSLSPYSAYSGNLGGLGSLLGQAFHH